MTEPCTQETNLAIIREKVGRIDATTDKILKILEGNGADGLITNVALNKQSIRRLWWWVGGVFFALVSAAIFVIRSNLQ